MTRYRPAFVAAAFAALALVGCASEPKPHRIRLATDDFAFEVTADVMPPRSVELTTYTIRVKDRETKEPVVGGEGRLFATNGSRITVWDGFAPSTEPGSYTARVRFLTAGQWQLGIQFRASHDTTVALQRTHDWGQLVRNESPPEL
ncbi:MAG: hypothetical protein FJ361_05675 [Gemmatimonadetes bacterium]|nr:hypothetical protein [Gemmatimonadota bacterium]